MQIVSKTPIAYCVRLLLFVCTIISCVFNFTVAFRTLSKNNEEMKKQTKNDKDQFLIICSTEKKKSMFGLHGIYKLERHY